MICNLSAPQGQSVNDFINPEQCSVLYASFDGTTAMISKLGRGALLGKKDIPNAFRLVPICPEEFPLLIFHFKNNFYIDKCLPFGCMCNLRKIFHIIALDYSNYSKCGYNGPLPQWFSVCGPGKYQHLPPLNEYIWSCMTAIRGIYFARKVQGPNY